MKCGIVIKITTRSSAAVRSVEENTLTHHLSIVYCWRPFDQLPPWVGKYVWGAQMISWFIKYIFTQFHSQALKCLHIPFSSQNKCKLGVQSHSFWFISWYQFHCLLLLRYRIGCPWLVEHNAAFITTPAIICWFSFMIVTSIFSLLVLTQQLINGIPSRLEGNCNNCTH